MARYNLDGEDVWCILEPMLVVAKLLSYLRRQAENLGDQLQDRNHQQGQLAANLNPSINQSTSGVGRFENLLKNTLCVHKIHKCLFLLLLQANEPGS